MEQEAINFQTLFNIATAIIFFIMGWVVKRMFNTLDNLVLEDTKMGDDITSIKIGLPTSYITKGDLESLTSVIFHKLDNIENKLDMKADKI
jgi:prepilin signal peptidase PulO-like enzyme (type II secretory pathway)